MAKTPSRGTLSHAWDGMEICPIHGTNPAAIPVENVACQPADISANILTGLVLCVLILSVSDKGPYVNQPASWKALQARHLAEGTPQGVSRARAKAGRPATFSRQAGGPGEGRRTGGLRSVSGPIPRYKTNAFYILALLISLAVPEPHR